MKSLFKKYEKRDILIAIFLLFSILSVIIGIGLAIQFFLLIRGYYEFKTIGLFSIPAEWQEVDFMTGIYAMSWLIVGLFLLFLAQALKIKRLKYKIESLERKKKDNYIFDRFEMKIMQLAKLHGDIVIRINEDFNHYSKTFNKEKRSFFKYVNELLLKENYVLDDFLIFFTQENQAVEFHKNILGITDVNKKQVLLFEMIFRNWHYYLYEYFENIKQLLQAALKSEKEEYSLQEILSPNEKYLLQIKYYKKHISKEEILLLKLFCRKDAEMEQLCKLYQFL